MIVYKTIDQYDSRTGEKVGTQRVYDHSICDFTGEKIDEYENPNTYSIDYNNNDPCFGNGEGEGWLYDWVNNDDDDERADPYDMFAQGEYIFSTDEYGREVFGTLLELAHKELEVYSLDHLLRWSRGRMLEKVIKLGKYKIQDFLAD